MRKIIFVLLTITMIMVTLSHAEKIGVLTEIMKPEGIEVADGRLYVVEGPAFFVYNLNNPKLIKKFGKAGEGPGELNTVLNFPNSLKILEDKIIAEGFNKIIIFSKDSKGNRLYEIQKNFAAPKITDNDKKAIFNHLKKDNLIAIVARREGGWDEFAKKGTFTYPASFPHIRDIKISNDKLYVSTFERKENKEKCIIMDLNGNIIGTSYLPITGQSSFSAGSMGKGNRFYGIAGNKFYYLKENEDEEVWELHAAGF